MPWDVTKDGQFFLAGFEFVAVKGVMVSPNYQGWNPADSNKPYISRFSVHVDIKI